MKIVMLDRNSIGYDIKLYPLSRTFLKLEILIDGHLSFA